jgi:hypothetical protein
MVAAYLERTGSVLGEAVITMTMHGSIIALKELAIRFVKNAGRNLEWTLNTISYALSAIIFNQSGDSLITCHYFDKLTFS